MRLVTQQKRIFFLLSAVFIVMTVCISNIAAQGTPSSGTFTDKRDGKTDKTVNIGDKTWMAQNLNYQTSKGSVCNENSNGTRIITGLRRGLTPPLLQSQLQVKT